MKKYLQGKYFEAVENFCCFKNKEYEHFYPRRVWTYSRLLAGIIYL